MFNKKENENRTAGLKMKMVCRSQKSVSSLGGAVLGPRTPTLHSPDATGWEREEASLCARQVARPCGARFGASTQWCAVHGRRGDFTCADPARTQRGRHAPA